VDVNNTTVIVFKTYYAQDQAIQTHKFLDPMMKPETSQISQIGIRRQLFLCAHLASRGDNTRCNCCGSVLAYISKEAIMSTTLDIIAWLSIQRR